MQHSSRYQLFIVPVVVVFFLAIGFFNKDRFIAPAPPLPSQDRSGLGAPSVNPTLTIASSDRDDFSAIVDAMGPAVVNISTRRIAKEAPPQAPAGEGEADPFAPFFGPEEGAEPEAPLYVGHRARICRSCSNGRPRMGSGHVPQLDEPIQNRILGPR